MLRLFECFMEAAPQLVLQLYILVPRWPHEESSYWLVLTQLAAVATSLISLSWSLVSYQRSLRMSLRDKLNMTWQVRGVTSNLIDSNININAIAGHGRAVLVANPRDRSSRRCASTVRVAVHMGYLRRVRHTLAGHVRVDW